MAFELLIGGLPALHDTVDPSRRSIERSACGVEHAPIFGAHCLSGEIDLLRHFGRRQRDGWCLFDGGEPGANIAETTVDTIERRSVIGNSLARGRQIGDCIMQET